jgi:hypothetical protein
MDSIFSALNRSWGRKSGSCGDNNEPSASISVSLGSSDYVHDLLEA